MVSGPDHGPGVDVKKVAARSLRAIPVTYAMLIACCLPVPHGVGDRPSISSGHKRQSAQDVGERDHVHHRVWTGRVEHFSSNSIERSHLRNLRQLDFPCAGPQQTSRRTLSHFSDAMVVVVE